jgi:hypothetical protein
VKLAWKSHRKEEEEKEKVKNLASAVFEPGIEKQQAIRSLQLGSRWSGKLFSLCVLEELLLLLVRFLFLFFILCKKIFESRYNKLQFC